MAKRAAPKRKLVGGLFDLGRQAENERLRQENRRLKLAIGLLKWRKPLKKRGRPVGSAKRANGASLLAELENERKRFATRDGKKYSKTETLREITREIGKERGQTDQAIERHLNTVKFKRQLKTLLNQLTPSAKQRISQKNK